MSDSRPVNLKDFKTLDPAVTARPGMRIKIYVREDMIGAGKIDLMRAIAAEGSLEAAAGAMGLELRRARFLLGTMQRCFEDPLTAETDTGLALTDLGRELIARYDAAVEAMAGTASEFMGWVEDRQRRTGKPG